MDGCLNGAGAEQKCQNATVVKVDDVVRSDDNIVFGPAKGLHE
jgi:hypothetical protein